MMRETVGDRIGSNDEAPCTHPKGHWWCVPVWDGYSLKRECMWCQAVKYEANADAIASFRFTTTRAQGEGSE